MKRFDVSYEKLQELRRNGGFTLDHLLSCKRISPYIFAPAADLFLKERIDGAIGPVRDGVDAKGEPKFIRASQWLDRHRSVDGIAWIPGAPQIIKDKVPHEGGHLVHIGLQYFNLYRPSALRHRDAGEAGPWIEHVRKLYPDEAEHIIKWCAQRVQQPGEKTNHALVLGGEQGIGKDVLLEPVIAAVGGHNAKSVPPKDLFGAFNPHMKAVLLRIDEGRDLGGENRFAFYEHCKTLTAAPPDTITINEKYLNQYVIPNIVGVVITTNHREGGIYLPPDDRRHFVAWSNTPRPHRTISRRCALGMKTAGKATWRLILPPSISLASTRRRRRRRPPPGITS